jgi:DNA-binding GntR family transcriptional regulator
MPASERAATSGDRTLRAMPTSAGAGDPQDAVADGGSGAIVESLYITLRQAIIQCELTPGSILSQVQLARRFGVSRTPLREVLRMLEREGLVESRHNRRIRISGFSVTDWEEINAARIALESLAAKMRIRTMTLAVIDEMSAVAEKMNLCAERHDLAGWQTAHRSFHAILTTGPNQRMSDFLEQLNDHDDRYRRIYAETASLAWGAGARGHNKILECVRRFDADGVADAVARHIGAATMTAIAAADPGHDPVLVRTALEFVLKSEAASGGRESADR